MAFPQSFIDELLARNPIEEVVGRHVTLRRSGANMFGLCPFHGEKTASFSVAPDKGIYYGDTYKESTDSYVPMPKKLTAFTCYRNIPCHQACFYHASLFKERGYDLEFKIRADYEHFLWCFFKKEVRPVHTGLVIANYEGGGFSESKENQKRDRLEHKMTVKKYMKKSQLFLAKSYMVITLMPLRRALSNSRHFSKFYNGLKSLIYK